MMNPSIACVNPLILMQDVFSLVPNVLRPQTMCISRPHVGSPQIPSVLAFKTLKIAAPVSYTVYQTVCLSVSCFCARQRSYTVWHTVWPNRVTNRVGFWNFSRIAAFTRFCTRFMQPVWLPVSCENVLETPFLASFSLPFHNNTQG